MGRSIRQLFIGISGLGLLFETSIAHALTDDQLARLVLELGKGKGVSGNFWYDYQALIAATVALFAAVLAFSGVSRQINAQKQTAERVEKRQSQARHQQKLAFFNVLREDLQILKEDLEKQGGELVDVLDSAAEQSDDRIRRIFRTLQPRTGESLDVNSWVRADFVDDAEVIQQLERLGHYLRQLNSVISWIEKEVIDSKKEQELESDDLLEYYKRSYEVLALILKKLTDRISQLSRDEVDKLAEMKQSIQ